MADLLVVALAALVLLDGDLVALLFADDVGGDGGVGDGRQADLRLAFAGDQQDAVELDRLLVADASRSIRIVSPLVTLYCLPPSSMIAYIALIRLPGKCGRGIVAAATESQASGAPQMRGRRSQTVICITRHLRPFADPPASPLETHHNFSTNQRFRHRRGELGRQERVKFNLIDKIE